MAYQRIRQPKISDVIEEKLERLIIEGSLSPGQQLPPERVLAQQFDVSRPSIREAIQRLEVKQLLVRRQGGGTYVSEHQWKTFAEPLLNLLATDPETQLDLLEFRHAFEGLAAYFSALRGTPEDFARIQLHLDNICKQPKLSIEEEASAVVQFLIVLTESTHNVVLLHIIRSLAPLLEQNVLENLKLLHCHQNVVDKVSIHRANIVDAIIRRAPEDARNMSHSHLAYIEETLLELTREESRRKRSLRRIEQSNDS